MINKIFRRDTFKQILGVIFALLILFGLTNYFFQNILWSGQAVRDRDIQLLDSFELDWDIPVTSLPMKVDNWGYYWTDDQVLMRIQENQVILPVRNRGVILNRNAALTSFSLNTGEVDWQTEIPWGIEVVGQNSEHIFVINDRLRTESRESISRCTSVGCGHIQITAYDVQSGSKHWSIFYANMNNVDRLFINDTVISVAGADNHGSWHEDVSLNAQTGQALPEFENPTSYVNTPNSYETIITELGFNSSDVVSNFTDNKDYFFFLTESDASLWAIDKDTLQIVGQVQFNRSPFLPFGKGHKGFSVAVSDNTVVVYLGDSEQLFAFDFTPPE